MMLTMIEEIAMHRSESRETTVNAWEESARCQDGAPQAMKSALHWAARPTPGRAVTYDFAAVGRKPTESGR